MFKKFVWPLFLLAFCCAAVHAQNSHVESYGTTVALSRTYQLHQDSFTQLKNKMHKALQKAFIERARTAASSYCAACGNQITSEGQHCTAADCTKLCRHAETDNAKCAHCPPIDEADKNGDAKQDVKLCAAEQAKECCTECGRTRQEVQIYGHHHKPPYNFQVIGAAKSARAITGKALQPQPKQSKTITAIHIDSTGQKPKVQNAGKTGYPQKKTYPPYW